MDNIQTDSGGIVGTLLDLPIFDAEWVLYLLIGLSLVSVALMIERVLFYQKHRVSLGPLRTQLDTLLGEGKHDEAVRLLRAHDSFETNVVLHGLRDIDKGADSVEELLIGAEAHESERFGARLNLLATIGSNAPFIGLFGTVLGIIKAFEELGFDLASAGSGLMGSISEALVATGVGLFVAIPAVIAFNQFSRLVESRAAGAALLSRTVLAHLRATDR